MIELHKIRKGWLLWGEVKTDKEEASYIRWWLAAVCISWHI